MTVTLSHVKCGRTLRALWAPGLGSCLVSGLVRRQTMARQIRGRSSDGRHLRQVETTDDRRTKARAHEFAICNPLAKLGANPRLSLICTELRQKNSVPNRFPSPSRELSEQKICPQAKENCLDLSQQRPRKHRHPLRTDFPQFRGFDSRTATAG